jgi:hypothetical protein
MIPFMETRWFAIIKRGNLTKVPEAERLSTGWQHLEGKSRLGALDESKNRPALC